MDASDTATQTTPAATPANRANSLVSTSGTFIGVSFVGVKSSRSPAPSESSSSPVCPYASNSSSSSTSLRSDKPECTDEPSPRSKGSSRSSPASVSAFLRHGGHAKTDFLTKPAPTDERPPAPLAPVPPLLALLGVSLISDSVSSTSVSASLRVGRSAPAAHRHQNRPATLAACAHSKKLTHPSPPPNTYSPSHCARTAFAVAVSSGSWYAYSSAKCAAAYTAANCATDAGNGDAPDSSLRLYQPPTPDQPLSTPGRRRSFRRLRRAKGVSGSCDTKPHAPSANTAHAR